MCSTLFKWSASAPKGSRQPSASTPHVASSMTSPGPRPRRSISRIDCWAKIGARPESAARSARTCPGVASPRRSPRPTEPCKAERPRAQRHDQASQRGGVGRAQRPDEQRPAVELRALALELGEPVAGARERHQHPLAAVLREAVLDAGLGDHGARRDGGPVELRQPAHQLCTVPSARRATGR